MAGIQRDLNLEQAKINHMKVHIKSLIHKDVRNPMGGGDDSQQEAAMLSMLHANEAR